MKYILTHTHHTHTHTQGLKVPVCVEGLSTIMQGGVGGPPPNKLETSAGGNIVSIANEVPEARS
jgi:hypothetical protein